MSNLIDEFKEQAHKAASNDGALRDLVEDLSGTSRRNRQHAASVMKELAKQDPAVAVPFIPHLVEALEVKEAQTKWESLDALSALVAADSSACERAVPGAEACLFDEGDNGLLRFSAFRFLCTLGSTSKERSAAVWPLIDEAVQCYHGDPEFMDMLGAVQDFAGGNVEDSVKEELKNRMAFDAKNSRGALQRRAAAIVEVCS